jgi:uncharacterized protein (DUF488 family)
MTRPDFFTIGYGGRDPRDLIAALRGNAIQLVIDVRLRPGRAYLGAYAKAKSSEKGLAGLLARESIGYVSLPELGNPFLDDENWETRYQAHLAANVASLLAPLLHETRRFCLLCAERDVARCHRRAIALQLEAAGWRAIHLP